jgi:lipoic acid synthetase
MNRDKPEHGKAAAGPKGDRAPDALSKPAWIRVRVAGGDAYMETLGRLRAHRLHTVCEEALCPNRAHCWSHGRATILILGDRCTRRCRFCHVDKREVPPPDPDEPARVAAAVQASGLREIVLTSVTRDDLPDGGAGLWAETIQRVHAIDLRAGTRAGGAALPQNDPHSVVQQGTASPDLWERHSVARAAEVPPKGRILVEVLVPDFGGSEDALRQVCEAQPAVFGHNLETVPRLYPEVRPEADYQRSLAVLRFAAKAGLITKTSLMLGMGETRDEVVKTIEDAHAAGVRILYCGQYLQPTRAHLPVARYRTPAEFEEIGAQARQIGFAFVASAPLVRSSYHEDGQSAFVRQEKTCAPAGA